MDSLPVERVVAAAERLLARNDELSTVTVGQSAAGQ